MKKPRIGGIAANVVELEKLLIDKVDYTGNEIYGITHVSSVVSMPDIIEMSVHSKKYDIKYISVFDEIMRRIGDFVKYWAGF